MDQASAHGSERLIKVSGIGQDRPGIVYKIASVIKRHGGNILLQRSMQVAGEFAVVIVASLANGSKSGAQDVMRDLGEGPLTENFAVFSRDIKIASFAPALHSGTKYTISVDALDRQGIVEQMSLFLLERNLNLDAMESEVTHRPFEGTAIFKSTFEITVPDGFDIDAFRTALEQFEKDNELEIKIKPAE